MILSDGGGSGLPISLIAQHGVEDDEELAHAGDDDDLGFLGGEPFGEGSDDWVVLDGGDRRTLARPPLMWRSPEWLPLS